MFFNYDSLAQLPVVVVGIGVLSLFAYTSYNIFTTATHNNESLVNTVPNLDSINELPESTYPILEANNLHKIDVGLQTDVQVVAPVEIQAQVQTEVSQQAANLYLDASVQTSNTTFWRMFKDWILEKISINSSSIQTPTNIRVENWMDGLDSTQNVSTNSINSIISKVNSVTTNDLNSVISRVSSQAQDIIEVTKPYYDIDDCTTYVNIIREEGVHTLNIIEWNQSYIIFNDVIMTIDPNLINLFI